MTSGHKVLTNRGWFTAKEIEDGAKSSGFNRSSFWLPDGSWSSGVERSSASNVVGEMRLRENGGTGWTKPAQRKPRAEEFVRMAASQSPDNTSERVETFDLLDVGPLNQFVVKGESGPFIVHNCNGAAYVGEGNTEWQEIHDEKLQALDSILEEAAGMPVLVAYQFKSDLARLQRAFPKGKTLDQNPQTLKDWNAGKIPVMFAHPASAGHGLNLQDGGNILVFFSVDWNLENHMQIIERIGPTRQMQAGHDRNVFIYRILARDTVDEMVLERLTTKREVQDILLSAMKQRRNAK